MARTTKQDKVRELQRTLYRAAKADPGRRFQGAVVSSRANNPGGSSRTPAVKDVGEPCAGEPHARFEVAAGGNQTSRAHTAARTRRLPPTRHSGSRALAATGECRNHARKMAWP